MTEVSIFDRITLPLVLALLVTSAWSQVQLLNDEFDDPATVVNWHNVNQFEGWNVTQLESINIGDSSTGHLFLKPFTQGWYEEYRGALLFKFIEGDFIATTEVITTARDGSSLPSSDFSLAGIMVREPLIYPNQDPAIDWQPNEQNFIFMSIGQAQGAGYDFEIKNTCFSNSCLDIVPINTNRSLIRMARIDQVVIVLSRFPGGNWEVRNRYNRLGQQCAANGNTCNAPFSDSVQIGLVAYTDWPKISTLSTNFHNSNTLHPDSLNGPDPSPGQEFNPDLEAHFDFLRFDEVAVPANLVDMDLSDPTIVTDAELLLWLGFESQVYCPQNYILTDPVLGSYLRVRAGDLIETSQLIRDQADVLFGATEEIQLELGFEVQHGSLLEITLNGCQ